MPFVNVKLVDGVFTTQEKHDMAAALTEVMVKFEGSEAFREIVWVLIEELHTDGWHIGGKPFMRPRDPPRHPRPLRRHLPDHRRPPRHPPRPRQGRPLPGEVTPPGTTFGTT